MKKQALLVGGIGLGAGLMYLFDPDRGARRRALIRDQFTHVANKVPSTFSGVFRDLTNRAKGLAAEATSGFRSAQASDSAIQQRIRSKMGRIVSHPRAIVVQVENGRVTLRGPILASEVPALLKCGSSAPGVTELINEMDVYQLPGNISSLQGSKATAP